MLHTQLFTDATAKAALAELTAKNLKTIQPFFDEAWPKLLGIAAFCDSLVLTTEARFTVHNNIWDVPDPRLSYPYFSSIYASNVSAADAVSAYPNRGEHWLPTAIPVKRLSTWDVKSLLNGAVDQAIQLHLSYGQIFGLGVPGGMRHIRIPFGTLTADEFDDTNQKTIGPSGTVALPPGREYIITGGLLMGGSDGIAMKFEAPSFHGLGPQVRGVDGFMHGGHVATQWPEGMPFSGDETVEVVGYVGTSSAPVGYIYVNDTTPPGNAPPSDRGSIGIKHAPSGLIGGGIGGIIGGLMGGGLARM